jgi:carbon-monoxide dehydrogenase medium subunit
VIPSTLEYTKASSIDEAVAAVAAGAVPLSGGQSLMPMMRLRLAAPHAIVDLSGIPELVGICEDDDEIAVGGMTIHREIAVSELIRAHAGLVADAAGGIGSPQVRNRGTIGGSLGHADPHSDLPATLIAAGASVIAKGPNGERRILVEDLITTYLTTSLEPGEIITQVRIPKSDDHSAYAKFHRRAIDWTIVGVGVCIGAGGVRAAATGVADKPVRLSAFEDVLNGGGSLDDAIAKVADGLEPLDGLDGSSEYKKHLLGVMARKAHAEASSR